MGTLILQSDANDPLCTLEQHHRNAFTKISFFGHYTVCVFAVAGSAATNRLSLQSGLDWEVYYFLMLSSCNWLLVQSCVKAFVFTSKGHDCEQFYEQFGKGMPTVSGLPNSCATRHPSLVLRASSSNMSISIA